MCICVLNGKNILAVLNVRPGFRRLDANSYFFPKKHGSECRHFPLSSFLTIEHTSTAAEALIVLNMSATGGKVTLSDYHIPSSDRALLTMHPDGEGSYVKGTASLRAPHYKV